MELQGASTSVASDASLELRSAKLAKNQQEAEGQATLQLLESAADVPKAQSVDGPVGSNIDTYA